MDVHVGEAAGDHPILLVCESCDEQYETDETMPNDCPDCGTLRWDLLETDPDAPWREELA